MLSDSSPSSGLLSKVIDLLRSRSGSVVLLDVGDCGALHASRLSPLCVLRNAAMRRKEFAPLRALRQSDGDSGRDAR